MLVDRYLPVFAPETETGADTGAAETTLPPAGGEVGAETETQETEQLPDGPGSGRSKLRKQLESASTESKKAGPRDQGKYKSRPRQEQEGAEAETETQEGQQAQEGQQKQPTAQQVAGIPEAWSKEAKAEWAKLPPTVQAAVAKRETDMAAGVEQLKRGYAEIDESLKPYLGAIQQNKTTPAAAVKQLFSWMEALTRDAANIKAGKLAEAFPALARSYGIDPVALLAQMVQHPQQQQQPNQQQPGQQEQIPPAVKAYLDSVLGNVGQHINQLSTTVQQQSMAKTSEMLGMWSKDKPFYEDVRVLMAKFLSPGPNGEPPVVLPLPNGNADLDKAYDMAVYADPAVRAKVAEATRTAEEAKKTEAAAAEKAAQKVKLEAARKASGSIPISAPGTPAARPGQKQKRGKSVRESLEESLAEVRERA
jgi:hypothetical protein